METQPLLSVIVPIYNAGDYLNQCLDSIETQTYKNLEIICLNDGSTDNSLEIIKTHAASDQRITILDKKNQGYGATCNRGIKEAHGSWISIVEPDDWIEPGMYATMLSVVTSSHETLDVIKTPYWRIWMPDTLQQRKMNCSYRNRINPPSQPFTIKSAAHLLTHHPSIWSGIYRADFLKQYDIRFKEIPGAGWADNPFLIETLCQAEAIAYIDEPFYCYREETPEKSKAFALNNTLLPLERWSDMMDVLERLNITDECVLRAHNSRGFTYLSGIIEEVDLSHDNVREQAIRMCKRMDQNLVLQDPEVSPGCKRMFCELLGLPVPKIHHLAYANGLIHQGLYNLKNTGLSNTIFAVKNYLAKRKVRVGNK